MSFKPHLKQIPAYQPPLQNRDPQNQLLLDFNESTIPPSPQVITAIQNAIQADRLRCYPNYGDLQAALANYAQVAPEQILFTNGADSALALIARACLGPGDEVIFPQPSFTFIANLALGCGATVIRPPYQTPALSFPKEQILKAINPRTQLMILVHPNNPTGDLLDTDWLQHLLSSHPQLSVAVDETYFEFSQHTTLPLLQKHANLIIVRSFSKAMAIAGLRFGYLIARQEAVSQLAKLCPPYDVNILAATAAKALLDYPQTWKNYVKEVMQHSKPLLEAFFSEHNIPFSPSHANFLLFWPRNPQQLLLQLEQQHILLRPQPPPIQQSLRVSIGSREQIKPLLQQLASLIARHESHP